MVTNARNLSDLLGASSTIPSTSLPQDVALGTDAYLTAAELPLSNNVIGDQAYVVETNRLYLWTGSGWYNIALINTNPSFDSGGTPEASYDLDSAGGNPTVITLLATDPEGVPITYSAIPSDSAQYFADITQADNQFTITAKDTNIIQQYDSSGGSFSVTFKASDGVNLATALSEFSISFLIPGEALFSTVGVHNWVVPDGVTSVCAVCVGGGGGGGATGTGSGSAGGGGGGGLGWKNDILVTPGDTIEVKVGGGGLGGITTDFRGGTIDGSPGEDSYIKVNNVIVCSGEGGLGGSSIAVSGGGFLGDGGGSGGQGGVYVSDNTSAGGGGGAGGYSGAGGDGGGTSSPQSGTGGGGGGGAGRNIGGGTAWGYNGGGTYLYGEGTSGTTSSTDGSAGSADAGIKPGSTHYGFGGGGGIKDFASQYGKTGKQGAVRIVWGVRSFPSTQVDYNFSVNETVI